MQAPSTPPLKAFGNVCKASPVQREDRSSERGGSFPKATQRIWDRAWNCAQVSLSSHYPLACPLHSAPLGPLFPVLGNFCLPPLGFVGGEAEGKGHLWL